MTRRSPHVRPVSRAAAYRWRTDHPRRVSPAVVEIAAGIAAGTICALAIIGALYVAGLAR